MVDLHIHSNISDGMDTPTEIIRKANKLGLYAIALTDHDSIDGLEEASTEAKKLGLNFIKGIELSVAYGKGRLIHILGIGINPQKEEFLKVYNEYRSIRDEKIDYVIRQLNKKGIIVSREDLMAHAVGGKLDRQAITKWLLANDYVPSIHKAWVDIVGHIPYIEGELIQPEVALRMIKASGGYSFLAHYTKPIGLKGYSDEEAVRRLQELKEMGLDGMERYYPSFTKEDIKVVDSYVERFGFMISGGSDYHGSNRPHIELGNGEGTFFVPDEIYEKIIK